MRLFLILITFLYHFASNAETAFAVGSGYRQDSLNWNIAGPNGYPNVLSELKWDDIKMWEISGQASQSLLGLCLSVEADYAVVLEGKNRDSDYLGNNRTLEFSRSYSDAKDGYAYDLSASLGWNINFLISPLTLSPQIGYAYNKQHFTMKNGNLTIDLFNGNIGPFSGLDSSYTAEWHGPWLGMDASFCFYCPITIFGSARAYALCYNGRGHWNLRSDFADDFRHHGYGYGLLGRLGVQYSLSNCWAIGILGSYQEYRLRHGHDKMYINVDFEDENGNSVDSSVYTSSTRLNQVNWRSFRVQVYLAFNF